MKSYVATSVFCVAFFLHGKALGCSLVPGHFHQVTAIRGRVVGKDLGPFDFRWLRQSFRIAGATLTLYEYRFPATIDDLKQVATTRTDSKGNFDFGSVQKGHYHLLIAVACSDTVGGSFDVEVTDTVNLTDSVLLDVSPIHPDCTGGHEFVEKKLKNATSH